MWKGLEESRTSPRAHVLTSTTLLIRECLLHAYYTIALSLLQEKEDRGHNYFLSVFFSLLWHWELNQGRIQARKMLHHLTISKSHNILLSLTFVFWKETRYRDETILNVYTLVVSVRAQSKKVILSAWVSQRRFQSRGGVQAGLWLLRRMP
jgi:hypothetical protein